MKIFLKDYTFIIMTKKLLIMVLENHNCGAIIMTDAQLTSDELRKIIKEVLLSPEFQIIQQKMFEKYLSQALSQNIKEVKEEMKKELTFFKTQIDLSSQTFSLAEILEKAHKIQQSHEEWMSLKDQLDFLSTQMTIVSETVLNAVEHLEAFILQLDKKMREWINLYFETFFMKSLGNLNEK